VFSPSTALRKGADTSKVEYNFVPSRSVLNPDRYRCSTPFRLTCHGRQRGDVESLVAKLHGNDQGDRSRAMIELAMAGPSAVLVVIQAVNDPNPAVRGSAVLLSLGAIGHKQKDAMLASLMATLIQALKDPAAMSIERYEFKTRGIDLRENLASSRVDLSSLFLARSPLLRRQYLS
jgi:HEAT repeats